MSPPEHPIAPATALYAALLAKAEGGDDEATAHLVSEVADVLAHPEHARVLVGQVAGGDDPETPSTPSTPSPTSDLPT